MKVAVVGHIEWCQFARVEHLPAAGEIVRTSELWREPAGGGGVAAVQLARLAGNCLFFTAISNDSDGQQCIGQLEKLGVEVFASVSDRTPTKTAFIHIDSDKERTITVSGNLTVSGSDDSLPWHRLKDMDAVYFVSGDEQALVAARQARKLVTTARTLPVLKSRPIQIDALVMSQKDAEEQYADGDLEIAPKLVVKTNGAEGGVTGDGEVYEPEIVPPEKLIDTYGCGDSFAAGLTYGFAQNLPTEEVLRLAAHSGAQAAMRKGAHGAKLDLE